MVGAVMRRILAAILFTLGVTLAAPHAQMLQAITNNVTHAGISYSGPGDIQSGAPKWGGLRSYSNATVATNAVDVNCNSDTSTTYTIKTLSNGTLDLTTLSADCGVSTAHVSKLYNKGSDGQDWTQATAAKQPTIALSATGGQPCLASDGTQSLLSATGGNIFVPFTYVAVAVRTSGTSNSAIGTAESNANPNAYFGSSGQVNYYDGQVLGPATANNNTFYAFSFVSPGGTGTIYVNGTSGATHALNNGFTTILSLFSLSDGTSQPLTGKICEFGVWGVDFSASSGALAAAMSSNQRSFWGF